MGRRRRDLVIIDPQNDFCDPKGALYVPGAEDDLKRIAEMIIRSGDQIKRIHVTLDCHHYYDIAHPGFWENSQGENPDPFTIIAHQDVVNATWSPVFMKLPGHDDESAIDYLKRYTKALEDGGRYPLCVWPPHCLISTWGNAIPAVLGDALMEWEKKRRNNVNFVSKGSNPNTEHYSGVKAEVPDPKDPSTQLNTRFIQSLKDADEVLLSGEALSHCVKNTGEDIADGFGDPDAIKKLILLTDGSSPVISPAVDFPAIAQQFVEDMRLRGMQTAETTDF